MLAYNLTVQFDSVFKSTVRVVSSQSLQHISLDCLHLSTFIYLMFHLFIYYLLIFEQCLVAYISVECCVIALSNHFLCL